MKREKEKKGRKDRKGKKRSLNEEKEGMYRG